MGRADQFQTQSLAMTFVKIAHGDCVDGADFCARCHDGIVQENFHNTSREKATGVLLDRAVEVEKC